MNCRTWGKAGTLVDRRVIRRIGILRVSLKELDIKWNWRAIEVSLWNVDWVRFVWPRFD